MIKKPSIAIGCCGALMLSAAFAEISILEEDPPGGPFVRNNLKYDRFTFRTPQQNADVFMGRSHDWAGVGREIESNGNFVSDPARWGTLISGSFFVTAHHHRPRANRDLAFYFNNDPTMSEQASVDMTWALYDTAVFVDGEGHPTRDGALGVLEQPVSEDVATYPIYVANDYENLPVLIFGISGGAKNDPTGQKVGWQQTLTADEARRSVTMPFFFGIDELALPRLHDSGGPSFVISDNPVSAGFDPTSGLAGPALLSTNWFGGDGTAGDGPTLPPGAVFALFESSSVALYQSEIDARMDEEQDHLPIHLRERAVFITDIVGDYNADFVLDADDITLLSREAHARSEELRRGYNWALDLAPNGLIDDVDVTTWLALISTVPGDANLDGVVDFGDFNILAANFNTTGRSWAEADFNGDGAVDLEDFLILRQNF